MKASEQFKLANNGFGVSNHTFINQIAAGIQKRLNNELGIKTKLNKSHGNSTIEINITGVKVVKDNSEMLQTEKKAESLISNLKNPSNLLSLLD